MALRLLGVPNCERDNPLLHAIDVQGYVSEGCGDPYVSTFERFELDPQALVLTWPHTDGRVVAAAMSTDPIRTKQAMEHMVNKLSAEEIEADPGIIRTYEAYCALISSRLDGLDMR